MSTSRPATAAIASPLHPQRFEDFWLHDRLVFIGVERGLMFGFPM